MRKKSATQELTRIHSGKGWEKIMPSRGFFRYINPGPFNIKEHAVVIIMCSTAASSAVAIQVISVQDLF